MAQLVDVYLSGDLVSYVRGLLTEVPEAQLRYLSGAEVRRVAAAIQFNLQAPGNSLCALLDLLLVDIRAGACVRIELSAMGDQPHLVRNFATVLCCFVGTPIFLYDCNSFWQPLTVDLMAHPNRTHGVDANPLHIDLVNRRRPPEFIAFLGVRPDPLYGGYTELSNVFRAVSELSSADWELLSQSIFHYWKDAGVLGVGEVIEEFAIIDYGSNPGYIRFTAKMIPHLDGTDTVLHSSMSLYTGDIRRALNKLYNVMRATRTTIRVQSNSLLLFNQRLLAHGRTALGSGQSMLNPTARRLILQAYMHRRENIVSR